MKDEKRLSDGRRITQIVSNEPHPPFCERKIFSSEPELDTSRLGRQSPASSRVIDCLAQSATMDAINEMGRHSELTDEEKRNEWSTLLRRGFFRTWERSELS